MCDEGGDDDLEYYVRECADILGISGKLAANRRSAKHVLQHVFQHVVECKKLNQASGTWLLLGFCHQWHVKLHSITTTTVLRPYFWDHPGEPVPEQNFWTLWCKGTLTEADTPTIRLGATPTGLTTAHLHHPAIFFTGQMPFPAAQPTASKHWRQQRIRIIEKMLELS